MRKSSHFDPRLPACAGCGGSGRNKAGNDACPACRGWGNAPQDPRSPEAKPGTICTACGNPSRPGDPVLATASAPTHRSHVIQQSQAYHDALARLRCARCP